MGQYEGKNWCKGGMIWMLWWREKFKYSVYLERDNNGICQLNKGGDEMKTIEKFMLTESWHHKSSMNTNFGGRIKNTGLGLASAWRKDLTIGMSRWQLQILDLEFKRNWSHSLSFRSCPCKRKVKNSERSHDVQSEKGRVTGTSWVLVNEIGTRLF